MGNRVNGRLGDNGAITGNATFPVTVQKLVGATYSPLTNIQQVSCGPTHTLALDTAGNVWAWGGNTTGALGDNTTVDKKYAVKVRNPANTGDLSAIKQISAGGIDGQPGFSMATAQDGTIYFWGSNQYGVRAATASTTAVKLPVAVTQLKVIPGFPTVTLAAAVTTATAPGAATLTATVGDPQGTANLQKTEFFLQGTLHSTRTAAPWTAALTNLTAGSYHSYAKTTDLDGNSTTSLPATFSINPGNPNDTDGDGLLDTWEIAQFGSLTSQSATGDPDGDALTNLQEYTAASNPNDFYNGIIPTLAPLPKASYLVRPSQTLALQASVKKADGTAWANAPIRLRLTSASATPGSLTPSATPLEISTVTNASGLASFNYVAPATQIGLATVTLTLRNSPLTTTAAWSLDVSGDVNVPGITATSTAQSRAALRDIYRPPGTYKAWDYQYVTAGLPFDSTATPSRIASATLNLTVTFTGFNLGNRLNFRARAVRTDDTVTAWSNTATTYLFPNDPAVPTPGNDILIGTPGPDTLTGGLGDDQIYGGYGADTYRYLAGDGNDTYSEATRGNLAINTLHFGPGITPADVTWQVIYTGFGSDLEISVKTTPGGIATTNKITIKGWSEYITLELLDPIRYERENWLLQFSNGTILSHRQMPTNDSDNLLGTAGPDTIRGGEGYDTIHGEAGDDFLYGDTRGDELHGDEGNDTLEGGEDPDHLYGGAGSDTLYGGTHNDTLEGGDGNDHHHGGLGDDTHRDTTGSDTYHYNLGDGQDNITDGVYPIDPGSSDRLVFGPGITPADVTVTQQFRDLHLTIGGSQPGLVIIKDFHQYFSGWSLPLQDGYRVMQFGYRRAWWKIAFTDGTLWDGNNMLGTTDSASPSRSGTQGKDLIQGTAGNDKIYANNEDDWIIGGPGNDELEGGNGSDRYDWNRGDGHDTLVAELVESNPSVLNRIVFGPGIQPEQLFFTKTEGFNLTIVIRNPDQSINGSMVVFGWFLRANEAAAYRNYWQLEFASGLKWKAGETLAETSAHDIDGDSIADIWEIINGLNPLYDQDYTSDSDLDGWTARQEFLAAAQAAAADPRTDTDGDTLLDIWERSEGLDPYVPDFLLTDSDQDGLNLAQEASQNSSDRTQDTDQDGWNDLFEFRSQTNPNKTDSDADGISDFDEDTDGDKLANRVEVTSRYQLDPLTASSFGNNETDKQFLDRQPALRVFNRELSYHFVLPRESGASGSGRIRTSTNLSESSTSSPLSTPIPLPVLASQLATAQPYPSSLSATTPGSIPIQKLEFLSTSYTSPRCRIIGASLRQALYYLAIPVPSPTPINQTFILTSKRIVDGVEQNEPDYPQVITFTIPATAPGSLPVTVSQSIEVNSVLKHDFPLDTEHDEKVTHRLVPADVDVAVDADRNGEIEFGVDKTTAETPYEFWLNNDRDIGHTVDGDDWEEDDVPGSETPETFDIYEPGLKWRRDMEDLSRIWIDMKSLNSALKEEVGGLSLYARIVPVEGNPTINLFRSVEPSGGRQYLTDEDTGYNQTQGIYSSEICSVENTPEGNYVNIGTVSPTNDKIHILFEAKSRGKGKLIFELRRAGQVFLELQPVFLDLKNVEDMYETWTVGDSPAQGEDYTIWPTASASKTTGQNLPLPQSSKEKDYFLFVHGWNMEPFDKKAYASTAFKRLWHQGYKGRFGAFRWPTFWFAAPVPNTDNFDGSEQRAWNSAAPLGELISQLSQTFQEGGQSKVRLYSHSMGNVVASECLRQMAPASKVHTYISAQAALSSHAWDNTTPFLPAATVAPNVYGHYWEATALSEPHAWPGEARPSYLDTRYVPSGVRYINHYNPLDWALSWRWQANQVLKPNYGYQYGVPTIFPQVRFRYWKSEGFAGHIDLNFPSDRFEIFSYAAGSRSYATGQEGATDGVFDPAASTNLNAATYGFGGAHKGHSAQFRSTIQKRWVYWKRVLNNMIISVP